VETRPLSPRSCPGHRVASPSSRANTSCHPFSCVIQREHSDRRIPRRSRSAQRTHRPLDDQPGLADVHRVGRPSGKRL
ncbi:MAG: hypothetical protein AVDCRST_MAG87-2694, partial [uncultured Thermomicrobiales bacterium]